VRRLAPAVATLLAATLPALADWTMSGSCAYVDREFDVNGFTGNQPLQAIRFADVQVIDTQGTKVIGTGVTGVGGNFTLVVVDNKTRDIYVRCLARRQTTFGIPVEVRASSNASDIWALRGPTIANHLPTQNVSAGTLVAVPGSGGEAFNLYDNALYGTQYLNELRGGEAPAPALLVVFNPANANLSSYDGTAIVQANNAGYDDTVMLHEMGHYVIHRFSASHSPGGSHRLSDCNQDLRLAWDEGHATFFGNSVRRRFNLPNSSTYVRTTGQAGPGNLQFSFDTETQLPFVCLGATSETTVYASLWDIVDGPASTDGSPGTDEPWDLLQGLDSDYWDVLEIYLPTAANISLEDFWDGWFHPSVANGHVDQMRGIFRQLGVRYEPDPFEPNDLADEDRLIVPGPAIYELTYFADRDGNLVGEPDMDRFSFDSVGGATYTIETLELRSDANTVLQLLADDDVTVLASNDDRAPSDKSSLISYTPPASARLRLRSFHGPGLGIYGSYKLRVAGAAAGVDGDQDGYTTANDCNDANPSVHPGAVEVCNLQDDNCNQVIDEGFDQDGDGYTTCAGDCNNVNAQIHPGAAEICNGIDDDCDLSIDEGGFGDLDGDGILDCVDPDDDGDGVSDGLDCAPESYLASDIPVEVEEHVTHVTLTASRILWDPVPEANIYNTYRAQLPITGPRDFDTACLLADVAGTEIVDPDVPPVGAFFFYQEAGRNECGEGSLGADSAGVPRVPGVPCDPQDLDSDGDLVADLLDTCPLLADPGQTDDDLDGRGDPCDNCPATSNADQADQDADGDGDACDDGDLDGFPVQGDCDDTDPDVNPDALEIENGVDDDCDGLIDDVVEVVTITLATWQSSNDRLTVEATTNHVPGSVTLTVVGFGSMSYQPAQGIYRLTAQGVPDPGSVTVVSTAGGSATSPVTPL
jgi:hypothetical protein